MRITEVAKRAGVSIATVSRTIHKPQSVRADTAARVLEAIEELNYYPNSNAQSLVSGRSHILGLIVSDITNPFFPELVKGLDEIAKQNQFDVLISSSNYDSARMAVSVRRFLERKVDGVAIMTSEMDADLVSQLARRNMPMVFLDVGNVDKGISNIQVDYRSGIIQAVNHLLDLGHQRIAFISGPQNLKSARIRRQTFLECLADAGIVEDERLVQEGNHKIDGGLETTRRLLALPCRPTAVLCSNDLTAIGALRGIRQAGLRIPDDVSVIGFDDIDLAQFTEPPLTTIRLSRTEIAHVAFEALMQTIQRKGIGAEYTVKTDLVVRESTAQVRG